MTRRILLVPLSALAVFCLAAPGLAAAIVAQPPHPAQVQITAITIEAQGAPAFTIESTPGCPVPANVQVALATGNGASWKVAITMVNTQDLLTSTLTTTTPGTSSFPADITVTLINPTSTVDPATTMTAGFAADVNADTSTVNSAAKTANLGTTSTFATTLVPAHPPEMTNLYDASFAVNLPRGTARSGPMTT